MLVRLPATLASDGLRQPGSFPGYQLPVLVLAMLVSHFLILFYIVMRARAVIRQLHLTTTSASAIAGSFDRLLPAARWATLLLTGCYLYLPAGMGGGALPAQLAAFLETTRLLKHIPLLSECIYVAPALLTWIGFWTAQYFVESAYRERLLPYRLATAQPAHDMPSLGQYLSMQVRHNFYLAVPIVLFTLLEYAAELARPRFPSAPPIAVGVAILLFLLMTPWLITCIWTTVPLAGPLRVKLDSLAAGYRLRFNNILVWKTHNAITNAAILGYLPFSRYFLMTDALLESLTDQQLEAVFAHEVGHGYHRHLWWYLAGLFSASVLTCAAADLLAGHLPEGMLQFFGGAENASMVLSLVLLVAILAVGFSFVSHRFEHQADYFAAKHMGGRVEANLESVPLPAAMALQEETVPMPPRKAGSLPASGAEMFISALDTIVDLAHRSRQHRGWMHPSVNRRVELLRELESSPVARERFERMQMRVRVCIVVFAGVAGGVACWAYL